MTFELKQKPRTKVRATNLLLPTYCGTDFSPWIVPTQPSCLPIVARTLVRGSCRPNPLAYQLWHGL